MADPICRWRNSSIKQLIEFNSIFPLLPIEKSQGREYVEKNWKLFGGNNFFTTPYQLAAQMGVYYENESFMYPRFHKLITIDEAYLYLQYWGKNYYAPNPYTKSILQEKTVVINNFLVNWVKDKGSTASFSEALREMFSSEIGNADILINMLNNFSEVQIEDDIVSLKEASTARYSDSDVWLEIDQNDKEAFFRFVCKDKYHGRLPYNASDEPLQQIYFGAPGTGKSHTINKKDGVTEENSVRTTFHPDSDYSTFVGCYKPVKKAQETLSIEDLIYKLKEAKNDTYPCQKIAAKYWSSFQKLSAEQIKNIISKCGFTEAYYQEINKGIAIGEDLSKDNSIGEITYEFVPQVFTTAYVNAWKDRNNPYYLIIEEINRGNCAQIFGDIFQLLDRDENGMSSYKITPDKDLQDYLATQLKDCDIDEDIKTGRKMQLPSNLNIIATMNTSDQSLFPIDSAFKRRWDWKYIPINPNDNKSYIVEEKYSWNAFLQKVNDKIESVTQSEDKKMGAWFIKADDGKISADKFVSKVVFYLWNDIFKDFGHGENTIFKDEYKSFHKFFNYDGSVNLEVLKKFLDSLNFVPLNNSSTSENPEQVQD